MGIEPTSPGLRDRCIALSATVPCRRRRRCQTRAPTRRVGVIPRSLLPPRQSERADSNRRPPGPKPGAMTRLRYVLLLSGSCGNRTRLSGLKGQRPRTDRRTSQQGHAPSAQLEHAWARRAHAVGRAVLESASPGFQPGARPSQLPTPTKKARCHCGTGLSVFTRNSDGRVSRAQWTGRGHIHRLTGEHASSASLFVTQP